MNQYRVVYVEPGKPAVEKKIGTELEDLQAVVGGLIECLRPVPAWKDVPGWYRDGG